MLHLLFNWEDNSSKKNPTIKVSADTRYFDFEADEDQSSSESEDSSSDSEWDFDDCSNLSFSETNEKVDLLTTPKSPLLMTIMNLMLIAY